MTAINLLLTLTLIHKGTADVLLTLSDVTISKFRFSIDFGSIFSPK